MQGFLTQAAPPSETRPQKRPRFDAKKSPTMIRATEELTLIGALKEDGMYGGEIGKAVLELLKVFLKQGHSGHSAPLTASLFARLVKGENLSPLTCEPDEFFAVDARYYQNKRNPGVFREKHPENSMPYFIDALIWRNRANGTCWANHLSRLYFQPPFTPKTFYVETDEFTLPDGDYERINPDLNALADAYIYYTRMNPTHDQTRQWQKIMLDFHEDWDKFEMVVLARAGGTQ